MDSSNDLQALLKLLACTNYDPNWDLIMHAMWPNAARRIKENWNRHDWNYNDLLSRDVGCYCLRCGTIQGVCKGGALRSACYNCPDSVYPTNTWRYHVLLTVASSPFQPYYCHLIDALREKQNDNSSIL